MSGKLCFSYDFELAWGCRSDSSDSSYGKEYEQNWETIPQMLQVLKTYEIPSTWATVGAIMLRKDWDFSELRKHTPKYRWFRGEWYEVPGFSNSIRRRYYAPELVEQIIACPVKQEIASHTFTHIYASDPATPPELIDMELQACNQVANDWGIQLVSMVFPKNMVAYPEILSKNGLKIYRSLNTEWYWFKHRFPTSRKDARGFLKVIPYLCNLGRYIDEKMVFCPPTFLISNSNGMAVLKHSAFLPGFSGISKFISSRERVRRICKGIDSAIKNKTVLSVYFHPHNFNYRTDDCIDFFSKICKYAAEMRENGKLEIVTMGQLAGEYNNDDRS